MEKSLLDIIQPRQKYNFSAYRKESYKHLQFLLDRIRDMKQQLTALYMANVDYSRGKGLDEMYEAELRAYPLLTETFEGAGFSMESGEFKKHSFQCGFCSPLS